MAYPLPFLWVDFPPPLTALPAPPLPLPSSKCAGTVCVGGGAFLEEGSQEGAGGGGGQNPSNNYHSKKTTRSSKKIFC